MAFGINDFDNVSNREDLLDIIKDISPVSTPLQSLASGSTYVSSATMAMPFVGAFTTYSGGSSNIQVYDSDFGAKRIKPKKKGEDLTNLLESLLPDGRP